MGHRSAAVERPPELEPASVSTVVGWLASPASDPVTGQAIAVSGSRCVLWRRWTPEAEVTTEWPGPSTRSPLPHPACSARPDRSLPGEPDEHRAPPRGARPRGQG